MNWTALKPLRFWLPLAFLATAPLGLWLRGGWSFLTLAVTPLALCGLDWALGAEADPQAAPDDPGFSALPRGYAVLQIAVTIWTALVISQPRTSLLEAIGATLSVGVCAGIFGMLAAHELVHRRRRAERALGLAALASVGYMHFRIAHIHGHHLHAATPEDPATARRGEGAYRFIVRAVTGQLAEAWRFEAERLRRRGKAVIGPSNRMLWYFAVELVVASGFALLGPRVLVFFIGQSVLAVALLELFNYIAHYGLVRRAGADGRVERLGPQHSWNSSRRMNNWSLFNMGRHADHHRHPTLAYQSLESVADAPELPTGYAGAILLALIPPLWRKIMDPRADAWMAS